MTERETLQEAITDLVLHLRENATFYETAAKNATGDALTGLFHGRADRRRQFAEELETANWETPVTPEEDVDADDAGPLAGIRRGLMTLESAMTIERDKTNAITLEETQEEEAKLLQTYRETLAEEGWPDPMRDRLQRQFSHIQAAYLYAGTSFTPPGETVALALFPDMNTAAGAMATLSDKDINRDRIGVLTQEAVVEQALGADENWQITQESAGVAALGGTAVGGILGLAGGVSVAIAMGVGTPILGGAIPASVGVTAAGAGIGASFGGFFGALLGWGVAEDDTHRYIEGVREGYVLLAVQTPSAEAEEIAEALREAGGEEVSSRHETLNTDF
jgi:uncharacterized protein (TIGR02284 family)